MKTSPSEIIIYYNRESSRAKKVLAYAHSIAPNVKEIEYHKSPFTPTLLKRLLGMLNLRPKDLLNRSHPYYQESIRGRDFDMEGWLNIITNNPDLIKAPIAIKGGKAILCNNPTDIYQLK